MSGIAGLQDDDPVDDGAPPSEDFGNLGLQDSAPEYGGAPERSRSPPRAAAKSWSPPETSESSAPSKYGGGDKCPRCSKTVYFAEAREGPNNIKYHKSCFACKTCKKTLDSMFNEKAGEIYCRNCYTKEFGPKVFGYGGVSAADSTSPDRPAGQYRSPSNTTENKLAGRFGGGDKCPVCEKTVYFAEAREGPNNIKYHKACFACSKCRKTLDSTFTENKGVLYCKGCYAKEHGPAGFNIGYT